MIACSGVEVTLGDKTVLDGVDLRVERGEWLSIVGPNGAGKTTLLRFLAGLASGSGDLHLDGRPSRALSRRERARLVALVPPSPWLDSAAPRPPRVALEDRRSGREVTFTPAPGEAVRHWVVRTRRGGAWTWNVVPGTAPSVALAAGAEAVAVSAVDRAGNESPATLVEVAP